MSEDDFILTQQQREKLDRRLAADEADPTCGSNWEQVKARIRARSMKQQTSRPEGPTRS